MLTSHFDSVYDVTLPVETRRFLRLSSTGTVSLESFRPKRSSYSTTDPGPSTDT